MPAYRFILRRGAAAAVAADVPMAGELLLNTDNRTITVGDGATAGGLTLHPSSVGLGNVTNDAQLKAAQLETDPDLASDSDERVPSSKAMRAYVAAHGGGGAGGWTIATNPPTADYACGWISNGDANGVLYCLGTALRTGQWTNPHTLGTVTIVPSSTPALAPIVCDRQYSSAHSTANEQNSFIKVDLGSARAQLTRYTIQNRSTGGGDHMLVNWVLEGSNDDSTWTTLHTGTGTPANWASGSWAGYAITDSTYWRYLRWRQVGKNSSGAYYFCPGEIELYGTLRAARLLPAGATGWMTDGSGHHIAYF